jgi:small subunit ribosomal protein S20
MANIKQQIKRNKTNEKKRLANASFKSSVKTAIKAVNNAVATNDKEKAVLALSFASKKLDKGQSKGIYHKNFVARHKSSLALLVNTLA